MAALFDNPMGLAGFEFVEFASPEPNVVEPVLHSPCFMLNLLGDLWFPVRNGERVKVQQEPDWAAVLALSGTHLHLYGKTDARMGRKMGHLTVTGATADAAFAVGLGANVLVGGSQNSIALQPVSVEGQTGVNIAAGLAAFKLEYVQ